MIFRGLLLICICALLFSCEKEESQPMPETLIGEWEFQYSVDTYEYGVSVIHDTTYATDLDDYYSIVFDEAGFIQLNKNGVPQIEYIATLTSETQCCPGADISYRFNLEPNETERVLYLQTWNPPLLVFSDFFPFSEEGINGPTHTSLKNYFKKK